MRASTIDNRTPGGRRGPRRAGAFTIIEVLVVLVVIALLVSLVIVSVGVARRAAQGAGARQTANAISIAISQFQNDLGQIPPLVKDVNEARYSGAYGDDVFMGISDPIDPPTTGDLQVFSTSLSIANTVDRDYLRGNTSGGGARLRSQDTGNPDMRFSEYSLAWYLVGALPASIDGVDGPGLSKVTPRGAFTGSGSFGPYLAIDQGPIELVEVDRAEGRIELRDRNGTPIRFYRWLQGRPGETKKLFDPDQELTQLNIPEVVAGDQMAFDTATDDVSRVDSAKLRGASWGVVLAGPDGVFGDFATEGAERIKSATRASTSDPFALEAAAREDNIVEAGQ